MMNEISKQYYDLRRTNNTKRLGKGVLEEIIKKAQEKYNVRNKDVPLSTIRSRLYQNSIECNHRGTSSPMEAIEPAILQIAIQRGRMNQPLTVAEGLQLSNSLIKKGSKLENDVKMYLNKREQLSTIGSSTKVPGNLLGPGYWSGFRRRHKDKLISHRGVQFGHNCSEWCNYDNFKWMYSLVYEAMEPAGVVTKLPVEEWQNERGECVSRDQAVGEKVKYKITHPEHIIYVDEVGNNTCMKDDGSKGGQRFLTARGSQARKTSSTSDAHWTTLGFTASNGQPVMCAIIFASQTLSTEERLGIDIFAPMPSTDTNTMSSMEHHGPGKWFPGGPRCEFRGHKIPCYIGTSPKGSITSELLTDMLRRIDKIGVFPRLQDQPTPFLLLDGHGSRLEVPFLSYVNNPRHKWVVCIGVPNGTSLWQVSDSTEQNGCYKMYCSEYKTKLTSKKIEMGIFKLNLQRTDIIPIVNYAWARSFARVNTNIKARQARGWGPLNQILLSHPDILCTKPKSSNENNEELPNINVSNDPTVSSSVCSTPSLSDSLDSDATKKKKGFDIKDINITDGFAGETLCTIL